MKKMFYLCCSVLILLSFQNSQDQDYFTQKKDNTLQDLFDKTSMKEIALSYHDNGWITLKESLKINPDSIFIKYGKYFGLGLDDSMVLEKVTQDELGYSHYRFQQYFKGIKIQGMRYNVHSKDNIAHSANGKLVSNLKLNVRPNISRKEAKAIALKGEWKHPLSNQVINDTLKRVDTKDIIIIRKPENSDFLNSSFILVYNFVAIDTLSHSSYEIQVDPITSKIVSVLSNSRKTVTPTFSGTCLTQYNGPQNVYTYFHNPSWPCTNYYYISDKSGVDEAYYIPDGDCGTWPCRYPCIKDLDNNWDYENEKDLTSAFWAVQKAREYFFCTHNWKGMDNQDGKILIYPWFTRAEPYAEFRIDEYGRNNLCFGKAIPDKCNPMLSLDIVGHEYTHGVILYINGGVNYEGETGAIEEGLADIFGSIIQCYVEGYNLNDTYTMGEDVLLQNKYKRSLNNPNSLGEHSIDGYCNMYAGMSDTYLGEYWDPRSCDNCAVHANSSIMSHWFYLLAEGGDATNDNGFHYHVDGIGRSNAAKIAYRFIKDDLFDYYACYADARAGTLEAAIHQFGLCSNEYYQVINAWNAVGVNDFYVGLDHVIINNPTSIVCTSGTTFSINCMPCAGTIVWNKSDNLSWVGSNTGNSVIICPVSPQTSGMGSLSATLYTSMGTYNVPPVNFWVGIPQIDYVSGPSYGQTYNSYYFNSYPSYDYRSQASYYWSASPSADIYPDYSGASIYFYEPNGHQISVQASNSCGSSSIVYTWIEISNYDSYSLSPNPASNEVTITVSSTKSNFSSLSNDNILYDISIFNMYGVLQSQKKYTGDRFTIPINHLKDGNYFVRIIHGKTVINKQLIIQR